MRRNARNWVRPEILRLRGVARTLFRQTARLLGAAWSESVRVAQQQEAGPVPQLPGRAKKWLAITFLVGLPALVGCQQQMADQPSYRALESCDFFADGRSERPSVPGTVARGQLRTDVTFWTGRRVDASGQPLGATTAAVVQPLPNTPEAKKAQRIQYDQFVGTFPYPMTEAILRRGYERFMIYCVVCHDPLGTGKGKIVQRGYTAPPSYHSQRLRTVPPGYLFAVMSEGYGSMPSYGAQIPVGDRWAIAGYLRALQASQHFPKDEVSDAMRRQWAEQGKAAAAGGRSP
ncbi:MAG: c-type cytochrome [Pirellulales bacterium]